MEKIKKKVCIKCGTEKELSRFSKNKNRRDGLQKWCKDCCSEYRLKNFDSAKKYRRDYYLLNKDEISLYNKEYREKNKGKCLYRNKEYYKDNFDMISEQRKKYYKENSEEIKLAVKKYNDENKDKVSLSHKKYYERNLENIVKYKKNYYEENKENLAKYNSYHLLLTIEEDPIEGEDGFLMCRCSKCREYFYPKLISLQSRIRSLSGKLSGECRLYCSEECKQNCDIYKAQITPKSLRNVKTQSRCNQKTNRKALLDLQFDECGYNYCEKCGKEFKRKDLIIHHNIMVSKDHTMADDMSHQIIVCKDHHEHKGCE